MSNISLKKVKLSTIKNNNIVQRKTIDTKRKEETPKSEKENVVLIGDLGDFVVIPVDENGNPKK